MTINELAIDSRITQDEKFQKLYLQFQALLSELRQRQLSENVVNLLNQSIAVLNAATLPADEFKKRIKKEQTKILKSLQKEHNITTKQYYRSLWMVLGMSCFGIPVGLGFGAINGNMGMLGLGLPIGMVIGMLIGSHLDKKAEDEGRQLQLEIRY